MSDSSFIHSKTPSPEVKTSVLTDYPSAFQGFIQIFGRVEGDETTDTFVCPSRSALRSINMLTGANKSQGHKVLRTVAATLAPNVGIEMFGGHAMCEEPERVEMSEGNGLNDRLMVEPLAASDNTVFNGSENLYPSYKQTVRFEDTGLTHKGQEASVCPKPINCYEPSLSRLPSSRIWRVDSEIEIVHEK